MLTERLRSFETVAARTTRDLHLVGRRPLVAIGWLVIVMFALSFAASAHATPKQVVINSPVDGVVSSSPFESPPHHIAFGQWAFDIHTSQQARPVYARFGPANGNLTLEVVERSASSCKSGGGGWRLTVRARVDGVWVGDVYYLHLANPHGGGPIGNGAQIGTAAVGLTPNSSCWTGPHVHVEGINRSGSASCARRIELRTTLNGGSTIGVIGGDWVGANNQECPNAAFNVGPGGGGPLTEGSFIAVAGKPEIYRIAGGAPIYVDTWAFYGGSQPTNIISQSQFDQLRQYPADGTAIDDGPHVYVIAGGAPVYVGNWATIGGPRATVRVSPAAIANAGRGGVWNHLRQQPADGTFIAGSGNVYVMAGGAPIYVNSWDSVGGARPVVIVDGAAIARAGQAAPWNHISQYPADGTAIVSHTQGTVYVIAGGAPIAVGSWNSIGGPRPVTAISQAALDQAGGAAPWGHLRRYPANGTFISATGGFIFRFAGGAPIRVDSWAPLGGAKPSVSVDMAAINHAGEAGHWRFVGDRPADGTILQAGLNGPLYRTVGGVPQQVVGGTPGAVVVDPAAIANAGKPGFWRFLRAAPVAPPATAGPPSAPAGSPANPSTNAPVQTSEPTGATSGPLQLATARIRSSVVVRRGNRVRIGISAAPGRAFAGRRVLVQRKIGSRYRTVLATKVQRNGRVRAIVSFKRQGAGVRGVRGVRRVSIRLALPKAGSGDSRGWIGPTRSVALATVTR